LEVDVPWMCACEGMAIGRAKGRLKGPGPKLSPPGRRTCSSCAPPAGTPSLSWRTSFDVSRQTVYRVLERAAASAA